jgi:hypothetical protein
MVAVLALGVMGLAAGPIWAGTVHVSTSGDDAADGLTWTTAKRTVQAGLDAAAAGDEVWVTAGVYVENITLKVGVALYGGFAGGETDLGQRDWAANESVLDGNQAGSVVTAPTGAGADTRIDGFTIRNGLVNANYAGGGISCKSASPTIANNRIHSNSAWTGGGIFCGNASPVITNNRIENNRGPSYGGGIYMAGASFSPVVSGCTIVGNIADGNGGGGIYCGSSAVITNTVITGNEGYQGGGVYTAGASASPVFANCTITGNSAGSGGGVNCGSVVTIVNSVIAGNGAYTGGGIYFGDSSTLPSTIVNNTIVGNNASQAGAIYYGGSVPGAISNTIIAFNSSGIGTSWISNPPKVYALRNNCIYGNSDYNYRGVADPMGADGNISVDPMLAGIAWGDLHIQPGSPCVDAGDDAEVQAGWTDMDGQERVQGGHVDIGADESSGASWPSGPRGIVRVRPGGDDADDGSSWALAKRTVRAGIDAAARVGGQVWVAAGTYPERVVLPSFVHVYGGFAGTETDLSGRDVAGNGTILDGGQGGSVLAARTGYRISTIDGFTIRNGSGTVVPTMGVPVRCGGGIYLSNGAPIVSNNTITGNHADRGAGFYCSSAAAMFRNNAVVRNQASSGGGIYFANGRMATVTNCRIEGNTALADGGGVCIHMMASLWGQIATPPWSEFNGIADSTIVGNRALRGGGICSESPFTFVRGVTIAGNIADSGGGFYYADMFSPSIGNVMVAGSIVAFNSSGIYADYSWLLAFNCVYGNAGYNFYGMGNPTGTKGNISGDPLFERVPAPGADGVWGTADDDYGDLHLREDSPCRNAGDPAFAAAAGETDLDGQPRVMADRVDIGADEFTWAADANDDGYVDVVDLLSLVYSFGKEPGEDGYDGRCDFNGDSEVDVVDLLMLVEDFGK